MGVLSVFRLGDDVLVDPGDGVVVTGGSAVVTIVLDVVVVAVVDNGHVIIDAVMNTGVGTGETARNQHKYQLTI